MKACHDCGAYDAHRPNCPSAEDDTPSLRQLAKIAMKWQQDACEEPSMGYNPDFGPALDLRIRELAEENGFTYAAIQSKIDDIFHEEYTEHQADEGPHGRNI